MYAYTDSTRYGFRPFQNILCWTNQQPVEQPRTETISSSDPRVWGQQYWSVLHYMSAHYPENPTPQEKNEMKQFLLCFPVILPCKKCQYHYKCFVKDHYEMLDDICQSRENLFKFFVDLHNQVNQRNQKPILSLHEAKQMWYP